MSISSDREWRNNVHSRKVHCTWMQPCGLHAPQGVEIGGGGYPSLRNVIVLGLHWVIIMFIVHCFRYDVISCK